MMLLLWSEGIIGGGTVVSDVDKVHTALLIVLLYG